MCIYTNLHHSKWSIESLSVFALDKSETVSPGKHCRFSPIQCENRVVRTYVCDHSLIQVWGSQWESRTLSTACTLWNTVLQQESSLVVSRTRPLPLRHLHNVLVMQHIPCCRGESRDQQGQVSRVRDLFGYEAYIRKLHFRLTWYHHPGRPGENSRCTSPQAGYTKPYKCGSHWHGLGAGASLPGTLC